MPDFRLGDCNFVYKILCKYYKGIFTYIYKMDHYYSYYSIIFIGFFYDEICTFINEYL